MNKVFNRGNFLFVLSLFALLMSMLPFAQFSKGAATAVVMLSFWSEDAERQEVSWNYLGIIPIATCAGSRSMEALKQQCSNGYYKAPKNDLLAQRELRTLCISHTDFNEQTGRCEGRVPSEQTRYQ